MSDTDDATPADRPDTDGTGRKTGAAPKKRAARKKTASRPSETPAATVAPPPDEAPAPQIGLAPIIAALVAGLAGGALAAFFINNVMPPATAPADAALTDRIAALEQRLDQPPPAATVPDALRNEIGALRRDVDGLDGLAGNLTSLRERVDGLAARLAEVEQRPAGAAPARLPDMPDYGPEIAQIRRDIDRLTDDAARFEERFLRRLDALADRLPPEDLPERIAANTREMTALGEQLDDATTRLANLEEAVAARDARAAARALAVSNLARALAEGRPFATELATLARLEAPGADAIAALEPYADAGVATFRALREGFPALANAVITAHHRGEDAPWWRRLWASARDLVRIRPTGEAAGSAPAAVLARAEHRLARGDLAAALGEMERLEGAARAPAEGWIAAARARVASEEALATLTARALAGIGEG